jgi:hypothetical protein
MSSHLVYPETYGLCSELLDGRHLLSVGNVYFSLHPFYGVHQLQSHLPHLPRVSPISLSCGTFRVSLSSKFTHFCVVRPLCSFWRAIVGNVQDLCVWERTGLFKLCGCTTCVSVLGSSPLSLPVSIFCHITYILTCILSNK